MLYKFNSRSGFFLVYKVLIQENIPDGFVLNFWLAKWAWGSAGLFVAGPRSFPSNFDLKFDLYPHLGLYWFSTLFK